MTAELLVIPRLVLLSSVVAGSPLRGRTLSSAGHHGSIPAGLGLAVPSSLLCSLGVSLRMAHDVLSGAWSRECEEGKQSPQPPLLGCAVPGRAAAGQPCQEGSWLPGPVGNCHCDSSKEDREDAPHNVLPFPGSSQHPAQHQPCPGVPRGPASLAGTVCFSCLGLWGAEGMERVAGKGDTRAQAVSHTAGCAPRACWPWRGGPWPCVLPLDPQLRKCTKGG